jgi:hypothetical protein
MKKIVFLLLSLVLIASSVIAQQTASPGSSFKYTVNPSVYVTDVPTGSTFGWTITGGAPGDFIQTPGANNGEINVNWVNPGIYTISWLESSKHGCPDTAAHAKTYTVTVSATTIDITTADVAAYSCSSATGDVINVQFNRTLLASEYPVTGTASITINGITNAVAFTTNSPGAGNTATITITGFEGNSTQLDQTNNFTLNALNLKDAKGGTVSLGTTTTYTRNVYATPATNGITIN